MNHITMTLQAEHLILEALKEDISSEDVSTNAVMKEAVKGEVEEGLLFCGAKAWKSQKMETVPEVIRALFG